ncbi:MAG: hypothetical protein ACR2PL_23990 [Dehalococcoidia bacterium]
MLSENGLIALLIDALHHPESRKEILWRFEQEVGIEQFELPDEVLAILDELQIDIAHYEPNPVLRLQDRSFYSDEQIECVIRKGLQKLRKFGVDVPSNAILTQ